jgi:hypothetical protein
MQGSVIGALFTAPLLIISWTLSVALLRRVKVTRLGLRGNSITSGY